MPHNYLDYQTSFVYLLTTDDLVKIEEIVHHGTPEEHSYVSHNRRLTESQCRYLFSIRDSAQDKNILAPLLSHRNFPDDLLRELALSEDSPLVLSRIEMNPNAGEETRTILALRRLSGAMV
jgi:hypothetical protein